MNAIELKRLKDNVQVLENYFDRNEEVVQGLLSTIDGHDSHTDQVCAAAIVDLIKLRDELVRKYSSVDAAKNHVIPAVCGSQDVDLMVNFDALPWFIRFHGEAMEFSAADYEALLDMYCNEWEGGDGGDHLVHELAATNANVQTFLDAISILQADHSHLVYNCTLHQQIVEEWLKNYSPAVLTLLQEDAKEAKAERCD